MFLPLLDGALSLCSVRFLEQSGELRGSIGRYFYPPPRPGVDSLYTDSRDSTILPGGNFPRWELPNSLLIDVSRAPHLGIVVVVPYGWYIFWQVHIQGFFTPRTTYTRAFYAQDYIDILNIRRFFWRTIITHTYKGFLRPGLLYLEVGASLDLFFFGCDACRHL